MEPLVSISCITYNHAPFIRDALDGFLMQKTSFPFEIIIHDDASTDGTQDIIREYERNYPKLFNVIYQKENQYSKGVKIMRVFQQPRMSGKYEAWCEGDDYWIAPDKLQIQADYMEKHPECACTFHPVVWTDETAGGKVYTIDQKESYEHEVYPDSLIAYGKASVSTCSRVVRNSIAKKWPLFRRIADVGDIPALFLLVSHGYFHYFPRVMGVYRWNHPESYNRKYRNDTNFAKNHSLNALRWIYEFNLYSERRFETLVGKVMMYYVVMRLNELNAIGEYPWLQKVVLAAAEKKRFIDPKDSEAERKYWSWFVNEIGKCARENIKLRGE